MVFQPAARQWPPILRNSIGKVNTDIDMCTLSPQEAAFGIVVRLFDFLSKPNFPLQRASAVKVRQDWGATAKRRNTTKKKTKTSGRKWNGRRKKREKISSQTSEIFCCHPLLSSNTAALLIAPFPFLSLTVSKQTRSPSHTWRAFKDCYLSRAQSSSQRVHSHSHSH